MLRIMALGILLLITSCRESATDKKNEEQPGTEILRVDSIAVARKEPEIRKRKSLDSVADTTFVRLADYSPAARAREKASALRWA